METIDSLELDVKWFDNSFFGSVLMQVDRLEEIPMLRKQLIDESIPFFKGGIRALYHDPGKKDLLEIVLAELEEIREGL